MALSLESRIKNALDGREERFMLYDGKAGDKSVSIYVQIDVPRHDLSLIYAGGPDEVYFASPLSVRSPTPRRTGEDPLMRALLGSLAVERDREERDDEFEQLQGKVGRWRRLRNALDGKLAQEAYAHAEMVHERYIAWSLMHVGAANVQRSTMRSHANFMIHDISYHALLPSISRVLRSRQALEAYGHVQPSGPPGDKARDLCAAV